MKGALVLVALAASLPLLGGCGGSKKPPADPNAEGSSAASASEEGAGSKEHAADGEEHADGGAGESEADAKSASICTGFELDLVAALGHSACEVTDMKPTDVKPVDMKGKLDIKVMTSANKVAPGGKVDVIVVFANKSKAPLTLDFLLDPTPRFQIETLDSKKRRADMPSARQPPIPMGMPERVASTQGLARVTIVPNGTAHANLSWDAVRMRWAPEKLKGTPPEMGYPRVASGPLPKGKYTLRVVTPLLNANEGAEHEISAPKVPIEVGR
jgi:hypothetical protein